EFVDETHPLNVCTIMHRIARSVAREGASRLPEKAREIRETFAWRRLLGFVTKRLEDCNNLELTNCLWALATLEARGEAEEALVLKLADLSSVYLESFEPRNLALSAWALAKMGYVDTAWCRRWSVQVLAKIGGFEPRDLTMVLHAFGTLHWRDDDFLGRFCRE
ncbi:unnamed protein product, partial [Polarella glacialis]